MRKCLIVLLGMGIPLSMFAAAVWTGAEDGFWTNANNWVDHQIGGRYLAQDGDGNIVTNGVMAGDTDTVYFDTHGLGGATTIDFDGVVSVSNLFVTGGSTVPKYTFGSTEKQYVPILCDGTISFAETADTTLAELGGTIRGPIHALAKSNGDSPVTVRNNHASDVLVLSRWGAAPTYRPGAGSKSENGWTFDGTGTIRLDGDSSYGGTHQYKFKMRGTLQINCIFKKIRHFSVQGDYAHHIEILEGAEFRHVSGTLNNLALTGSLTVDGPGLYCFASGVKNGAGMNGTRGAGSGLTFNCPVTAYDSTNAKTFPAGWYPGMNFTSGTGPITFNGENNVTGTVQLLTDSSMGLTLNADKLGLKGTRGSHGWGGFQFDHQAVIRFTGSAADETDRDFCATNISSTYEHSVVIDQAGTANLTVRSAFTKDANVTAAKLYLRNNGAATGIFAGALDSVYALEKDGTGLWQLAAALTHAGATTLSAGTLEVVDGGAFSASSALSVAGGTTLAFSGTTAKTCPEITVTSAGAVLAVAAGTTVTLDGVNAASTGTLDIQTADKTAVVKLKSGVTQLPGFVTFNGCAAEVTEEGKVQKNYVTVDTPIAAYGGRIPNDSAKNVGVTTTGTATDGPIRLADAAGNSAAVKTLVQKVAAEAVVELDAGQTLTAAALVAEEDAAPLTIGSQDGQGTLVAASGAFQLWPDGESGRITVKATPSLAAATSIAKIGTGMAAFTHDFDYAGAVDVAAGTLAVTPKADSTAQDFTLTGYGDFVKEGAADWVVAAGKNANFLGDYVVRGGTVRPGSDAAAAVFGAAAGGALVITNGATLKTHGGALAEHVSFGAKHIRLADMGADGKGALVVDPTNAKRGTTIQHLTLDADSGMNMTTLGTGVSYLGYQGVFDMQGHTFTHTGGGEMNFSNCIFSNANTVTVNGPETVTPKVTALTFSGEVSFPNDPATFVLKSTNVVIYLNNTTKPISAALTIETNVTMTAYNAVQNTNYHHWAGAIALKGATSRLKLYNLNDGYKLLTLSGAISGAGTLEILKGGGHYYLAMPANTYTGETRFLLPNGSGAECAIGLATWQTIPDFAKLYVGGEGGNGTLALMASADRSTWPDEKIVELFNKATIDKSNAFIGIDPMFSGDYTVNASAMTFPADKAFVFGASALLPDANPHTVTFNMDQDWGGDKAALGSYAGRFVVSGEHKVTLKEIRISSHGSRSQGVMRIMDKAVVEIPASGSDARVTLAPHDNDLGILEVANATLRGTADKPYPCITFGCVNTSRGMLKVGEGAVVEPRLNMGGHAGARGATILQTDGTVNLGHGATVGNSGPGYWQLTGGSVNLTGGSFLCAVNSNTCATIEQAGGSITSTSSATPLLGAQKNGYCSFYQTGGDFTVNAGTTGRAMEWPYSSNVSYDSVGVFTLAGDTARTTFAPGMMALLANQTNGLAAINLNAGVLALGIIQGGGYPGSRAYVNFNGGTLKVNRDTTALGTGNLAYTLGEKGGVIDTDGHAVTLGKPVTALTGGGVSSVSFVTPFDAVGAAKVVIEGDGDGATAMTIFDKETLKITGIRVLSPGSGYTYATAKVTRGCCRQSSDDAKKSYACTITANATPGAFVKKGAGTLTLYAGTGLPAGVNVDVQEGTLDLNGLTATLGNVTSSGSGILKNGTAAVTLPSMLTVDVQAAAAGNYLTVAGDAVLPTTLALANLDKVASDTKSFTILKVTGAKTGNIALAAGTELPVGWTLEWTGNDLRLGRPRGMHIHFR